MSKLKRHTRKYVSDHIDRFQRREVISAMLPSLRALLENQTQQTFNEETFVLLDDFLTFIIKDLYSFRNKVEVAKTVCFCMRVDLLHHRANDTMVNLIEEYLSLTPLSEVFDRFDGLLADNDRSSGKRQAKVVWQIVLPKVREKVRAIPQSKIESIPKERIFLTIRNLLSLA